MPNRQKILLPKKLEMIALKLKSFAFMKIFMQESFSPAKQHKVRHYDLQVQGATAISSWLKTKLQQVYVRSFDRLKQCKKIVKVSSSSIYMQAQSQPYLSPINSRVTSPSKHLDSRIRCQTDREYYMKCKQSQQANNKYKNYRSEFGQQTQQSQNSRKSNLQGLLQKVRQVNTQSKIDKENQQFKANNQDYYPQLYTGSRVLSSFTGVERRYNMLPQSRNVTFRQHAKSPQQNYPEPRHQSNHFDYQLGKNFPSEVQSPNRQVQNIISRLELEEECVMDKNNLLSLKKWHKNQKRSVIMNKINELENSLMAEYSRDGHRAYETHRQEFYPINDYTNLYDQTFGDNPSHFNIYQMPANYSQTYFQQRTRQAPRSMHEAKMRKY